MSLPTTIGSVTTAREAAIESLQRLLSDRLSTAVSERERHGKDASYHPCVPPDVVVFAQSTEEVSKIVKICARHKVPLIPFGSGTGLEGNVVALRGGGRRDRRQRSEHEGFRSRQGPQALARRSSPPVFFADGRASKALTNIELQPSASVPK